MASLMETLLLCFLAFTASANHATCFCAPSTMSRPLFSLSSPVLLLRMVYGTMHSNQYGRPGPSTPLALEPIMPSRARPPCYAPVCILLDKQALT